MNKLLTILLIFSSLGALAQSKDTSGPMLISAGPVKVGHAYGYGANDWLLKESDGTIRIYGDTMKVIQMLVENYQKEMDESWKIRATKVKMEETVVDWMNDVPDHYRSKESGCHWEPLWKLLYKDGWRIEKGPAKTKPCKIKP